MTTQREKLLVDRKSLESRGYQIDRDNAIKPNAGSETDGHIHAKVATARVLWANGFKIDTEVPLKRNGSERYLDLLGYGCVGRNPVGIELETDLTDEKEERYRELYHVEPMKEIYCINLNSLSWDCRKMAVRIAEKLGLDYQYS